MIRATSGRGQFSMEFSHYAPCPAIRAYKEIADAHGLSAAQLALAWVNQVDGVTSSIIGATQLEQLKDNINAFDVSLTEDALKQIDQVLKRFPSPY